MDEFGIRSHQAIHSETQKRISDLEIEIRLFEQNSQESLDLEEIKLKLEVLKARQAQLGYVLDQLEELESQINKKLLLKHRRFNPTETWSSRWVASPIAYLFPKERREEWLGDLYEVNQELLHKGYPRWLVNLINVARTVILLVSGLQIKLSDLISLGFRKTE